MGGRGSKTICVFFVYGRWAHTCGAYNLPGLIIGSLWHEPTNGGADYWNFMTGQPGSYLGKSLGYPLKLFPATDPSDLKLSTKSVPVS